MTKYIDRADYGHDRSIFDCRAYRHGLRRRRWRTAHVHHKPDG